jgi:hypothetical protein
MRPHIPFLDTNAMPWQQLPAPGILSKRLSTDPDTGARTALQRVVPAMGYKAPSTAHWHHTDEEILVVKGLMSFDSKVWLRPKAYCFHPAGTVHGFKSAVPEESWFLSRVGRDLDFNYVPEPRQLTYYTAPGEPSAPRIAGAIADPAKVRWETLRNRAGKAIGQRLLLSRDPETGEGSMFLRCRKGWRSASRPYRHSVYEEVFVLEGKIESSDGIVLAQGCYAFRPPGTKQAPFHCDDGALLYVNFGGDLDYRPITTRAKKKKRTTRLKKTARR